MAAQVNVGNWSLVLTFSLVLVSLGISYRQKLNLEKETIISSKNDTEKIQRLSRYISFAR
jgi:ABC-type iron transport system FetAB permease component